MKAATERRQQMIEYLCEVRSTTRPKLMQKFNISKNTVDRDLQFLMCSYPIETSKGTGGGVRIAEGYSLSIRYMNDVQIDLLKRLSETLAGEELSIMQGIIKKYSTPGSCK